MTTTTIDVDVDGWPGEGERFDLVRTSELLAGGGDAEAALERVAALLAPGGVLIVALPGGDGEAAARRALADRFASVRFAVQGREPDARLVAVAFSSDDDQTQRWLDLLDRQWELLAQLDAELVQTRARLDSARSEGGAGRVRSLAKRFSR